jgi:hypothetical protein
LIWRPAQLCRNGQRSFKQPPRQQVAIFPICTPDVQGMLTGLQRQWLATAKPVPSQELGVETPPERLWRGRNRPGRRATLPFEGARQPENDRDDSGAY